MMNINQNFLLLLLLLCLMNLLKFQNFLNLTSTKNMTVENFLNLGSLKNMVENFLKFPRDEEFPNKDEKFP
ncbi:hypothetical protein C1645_873591 [Glomus cerebriforme]|uniref:Uncharacterized protein n=1 Tax=Glomus cerebriforme TaxID=658196 RepID=A0A397TD10_9GLOM|nr:hypothetical protein C1645_873591 [Glomus cerebriforme]